MPAIKVTISRLNGLQSAAALCLFENPDNVLSIPRKLIQRIFMRLYRLTADYYVDITNKKSRGLYLLHGKIAVAPQYITVGMHLLEIGRRAADNPNGTRGADDIDTPVDSPPYSPRRPR